MASLQEMHHRTSSNKDYDRMIRSVAPLCDYFNLSQFYYMRIQAKADKGYFSSLGTHLDWHECIFENIEMVAPWPMVRHPDKLSSQITLLKNTDNFQFNQLLDFAWNKYGINFTIDIQRKIPGGIESYGFGVQTRHPAAEGHLLKELPLLEKFISYFHSENKKFIAFAHDHQVEISSLMGPRFYEDPQNPYPVSPQKELLLKQLGLSAYLSLTKREIDVLKFLANGFPANYVAKKLHLSSRTVENNIAIIKSKLDCKSKVELILKAQDMVSIMKP